MMEWWNDTRMLVARYLVASEQMERDGPVAQAVRSVGYRSEEEEEEEEDEGGSSVEEEEEEEEEQQHQTVGAGGVAPHPEQQESVPAYSRPTKGSGIEVGQNGYVVGFLGGGGRGGRSSPADVRASLITPPSPAREEGR
jgi:hypothetical protein